MGARHARGFMSPVQTIAGIRILNLSLQEVVDALVCAVRRRVPVNLAFVNADCINIAAHDTAYRRCLQAADWVCADGVGMRIAGRVLDRPIRDNVNGTDLFPELCAALAREGASIYLLGARPGVGVSVARWVKTFYPGVRIAGVRDGYFSAVQEPSVVADIWAARPDVLLVAMGAPHQERWLARNLAATGATIGMGVGGLFDFYSGRIPRAPRWLRGIGGEWTYRLLQEPGRLWRRYLIGNGVFLLRVLSEKYFGKNSSRILK